jgi:uncharacterized glyoxalase superfamily protein PhnB
MAVKLVAYLSYADARAALVWLESIGFTVVALHESTALRKSTESAIQHAELRLDETVVMLASNDQDYLIPPLVGQSTGVGLYLVVDDVDGIYTAAIAAGGISVIPPENTEWGSRRARVLDPAGREWSFGSYEPGLQQVPLEGFEPPT